MMEREKVIELLKKLNISSRSDCWEVHQALRSNGYTDIKVSDGASKICLIFPDAPYVVKWSTDHYEEAMREVQVYQDAVAANLEKFFPKTAFLVSINGVNFVAQERIDFSVCDCKLKDARKFQRISRTALDKIAMKMEKEFRKASPNYRHHLDQQWAKMAIVLYGKKACKALCDFVIAHEINDLHNSNIGYKNGKPIILDFSGYNR